jgi:hypothetical protein
MIKAKREIVMLVMKDGEMSRRRRSVGALRPAPSCNATSLALFVYLNYIGLIHG